MTANPQLFSVVVPYRVWAWLQDTHVAWLVATGQPVPSQAEDDEVEWDDPVWPPVLRAMFAALAREDGSKLVTGLTADELRALREGASWISAALESCGDAWEREGYDEADATIKTIDRMLGTPV